MIDWRYFLLAQYPLFLLLAVYFLWRYIGARKVSALLSVIWVLLFGVSLAVAVLFAFLGINFGYWTLSGLFKLGIASWVGIGLAVLTLVARAVHLVERWHAKLVMDRELKKAAQEKEDAVALAREAGRQAAREESEALRLSQATAQAKAEASEGAFAAEANAPIQLSLDPLPEDTN